MINRVFIFIVSILTSNLAPVNNPVISNPDTPILNGICELMEKSKAKVDETSKYNFECICQELEKQYRKDVEVFTENLILSEDDKLIKFKSLVTRIHADLQNKLKDALETANCLIVKKGSASCSKPQDEFGKFIKENINSKDPLAFYNNYNEFVMKYVFKTYGKELQNIRIKGSFKGFKGYFTILQCVMRRSYQNKEFPKTTDGIKTFNNRTLLVFQDMIDLLSPEE